MDALCSVIELMLKSTPLQDLALFIDYCSLYQEPRTPEQEAAFTRASAESHLWFLHQGTRVWMLTKVPSDAECCEAYERRGGPILERALGDMATKASFMLDLGKLDATCTNWPRILTVCQHQRRPPLSPQAFAKAMQRSAFPTEESRAFAVHKYQEGFLEAIAAAKELHFSNLGWGNKEAQELAKILPHCGRLTKLALRGNKIGEEGVRALLKVLPHCKSLKELWVIQNPVGKVKQIREQLRGEWGKAGRCHDQLHI